MAWTISFEGQEFSSDDLTIEELEAVEKVSGEPWSMLNPIRSVASAKALLSVALIRKGLTDEEVAEKLGSLTVKDFRSVFDWQTEEGEPGPLELAGKSTSASSSSGPRGGSTGGRRKSAKSA